MLTVGGKDRVQTVVEGDGHAFPVRFVGLPEALIARAPVVEGVKQPVANEVAGGDADAGRRRPPSRNFYDAPVEVSAFPVAQSWCGALVAAITRFQRAWKVEAVARFQGAADRTRWNARGRLCPRSGGRLPLDTCKAEEAL